MTTHDMSQGQRIADRIGVLINGDLLQLGTPEEIFYSPINWDVAQFVGIENILSGVITEKEQSLATIKINGSLIQAISEHAISDHVYALIRPEDITFATNREKSSARNVFQGRITRITPLGILIRIEIDCGFPLMGVVTRTSAEELEFKIGKEVFASFKATAIHIIKRYN